MFSLFPIRSVSQLVQLPHASSASSVIAFTPIFCIFVSLGLFIFDTTILILFDYFRITPLLMIDDFVTMGCCIGFVLSCSLFLPGGRASVYLSHNAPTTCPLIVVAQIIRVWTYPLSDLFSLSLVLPYRSWYCLISLAFTWQISWTIKIIVPPLVYP